MENAAKAATEAGKNWRGTSPVERLQYLFELKNLLEYHFEEISRKVSEENVKTIKEANGEISRAIENVEVACGIPTVMQGGIIEDIAPGFEKFMLRQPVGVYAIITPFDFTWMIPFWFLPYALACGNTVIVKPSECTPMTMRVFLHLEELDLPAGIFNLVNGSADTVNAVQDHPAVKAISFFGSPKVARHIYVRASANGKRV